MPKKQLILIYPAKSNLIDSLCVNCIAKDFGMQALHILAALTPKDYHITMYKQKIYWARHDFIPNSLVGISCNTNNAYESYKLGDRFRKAGSTVVMGGSHASYMSQEALRHCDSVVIGEAEPVWLQVIKDYENGTLKKIYEASPCEDWASLSYEYFLSLPAAELRNMGLLLGRGCKHRCEFCVPFFKQPRYMRLEQAIALVSRVKAANPRPGKKCSILFLDNNIFNDPDYAKGLFNALIPLKIEWTGSCSIDIALDEEALRLAQASGCSKLCIGFETLYPQQWNKLSAVGINTTDDYIKAIRKIQSYGIKVIGSFILGCDDCTHKYCFELLKFFYQSGLYLVLIYILTPYPGSKLFERLSKENRITTHDWSQYDPASLSIVFKPKQMSRWSIYVWKMILNVATSLFSLSLTSKIILGILIMLCIFLLVIIKNLAQVL